MKFFHTWRNIDPTCRNGVVVIGNFDGVHRGHARVIQTAIDLAKSQGKPSLLLTFEPHPDAYFRPAAETFRITPVHAKVRAIAALNPNALCVLRFDSALAHTSARDFVSDILINGLHASHLVVGQDFCFGDKREGCVAFLRENYPDLPVTAVEQLRDDSNEIISSSRIRAFLRDGEARRAANLLGRPFEIEGRVIHGFQRGRTLGFPTINIAPNASILPKIGVYAAQIIIDGAVYDGIANIGFRPTVQGSGVLLEAHIFNFDKDVYGKRVRVRLIAFVREEKRFASLEELRQNIAMDCQKVREILK